MAFLINKLIILENGRQRRVRVTDDLEISGKFKASVLYGDGSNITALDASQLTSGTVADGRLSTNVAKYNDPTPTFANTLKANTFQGSGSLLTALPAGQVTGIGALSDLVLSSNIPRLDAPLNRFEGDLSVDGDLVVEGDVVSKGKTSLIIGDNFIDLVSGNTDTVTYSSGGYTVNMKATAGTVQNATDFYPSVDSNNAYLITLTTPVYVAGDIIQISGSEEAKNDGQYVVLSVDTVTRRVTIKGSGGTGTPAWVPFAHTNFVEQHAQSAFVSKGCMSVVATSNGFLHDRAGNAIPVGSLCCNYQENASEASFQNSWVNLDAAAVITLQAAYNNGSMIEASSAKGDFRVQPQTGQTSGFSLQGNTASVVRAINGATLTVGDATGITELSGSVTLPSHTLLTQQTSTVGNQYDIIYFKDAADQGTPAAATIADVVPIGPRETATRAATVYGSKVTARTTGAVSVGSRLYLSGVAGAASDSVPATGEIWLLGKCEEVLPGDLCRMTWTPQYITTVS